MVQPHLKDERHRLIRYFSSMEKNFSETEIETRWQELARRVEMQKRRIRFRLSVWATCAAALLSGIVWFSFVKLEDGRVTAQWEAAITKADSYNTDTIEQVLLVTQAQKQIPIEKNTTVKYSSRGEVSVGEGNLADDSEEVQQVVFQEEVEYNQLIVPKGKYSRLVLADGSSLYINACSKVVYPNRFEGERREIYVDGEVFIDVKPDKEHPFVIKTSSFDVQVLGTAFNVNAYKRFKTAEVVLLRGAVSVTGKDRTTVKMSPNELVDLSDGRVVGQRKVRAEEYVAWTMGRLPLEGKSFEKILCKLSLFYGVEIDYDSHLMQYPLYGTIDLSAPLETVLQRISCIVPMHYERKNGKIYLSMSNSKTEMPMTK